MERTDRPRRESMCAMMCAAVYVNVMMSLNVTL